MSANFMSAILAGVLAGAALTAVPRSAIAAPDGVAPDNGAVAAPDNCLASPQGAASKGQHWYYRLDSAKRKCWYLRAQGDSTAQSAASQPAASQPAAPTAPAATRAPARQPGTTAAQDAHAEWSAPQASNAPDTTGSIQQQSAWPPANPAGAQRTPIAAAQNTPAQQAAMDARAPEPATSQPAAASSPPSVAPAAASQPLQATQADATPTDAPTADAATTKPAESIHTLLLVIAGALALAGVVASIVLRLAARQRSRRRELHEDRRVNWEPTVASSPPPWRATPAPSRIKPPSPIEAPSLIEVEPTPDRTARDLDGRDRDTRDYNTDVDTDIGQITDFLEQFIRQGPKLDRAVPAADTVHPELQRLARSSARA